MDLRDVPRLYRRAILIYVITIVAPVCVLLWLGLQSFERQRQALSSLAEEKIEAELQTRMRQAAAEALDRHRHPLAKYFFTVEKGAVVQPALYAPPRQPAPSEFLEAEHQELDLNRPDLALESYRKLAARHQHEALALNGMARCLAKLGRRDEARATWRKLAASFPDERDLSDRPFGIVAALAAGDTAGLLDQIASGRWKLSADQANYFLSRLDAPNRTSPYFDQLRFARELNDQFHPPGGLQRNKIQSYALNGREVFYRDEGNGRISGFVVNENWVRHTLRPQVEQDLGLSNSAGRGLRVYGAAMAAVLLVLSAGIVLLLRDVSREARVNSLRADLVSSVSHELKTPITLIRLYGETLLGRPGANPVFTEPERRDFYRVIVRESQRLSRLVSQVLTFSRIERGAQVYNLEEGDLGAAIADIVDGYQEYLDRAGFTVERSFEESMPPVRFDATALSQAVINLLDNAVKYSGPSREIALRLEALDGNVIFEVEDHGTGIPATEREKIFERFYRSSNGSGKGGYGLGLFLVRHIMNAHGGSVEVESDPGRGSRFRLVFPAARAPQDRAQTDTAIDFKISARALNERSANPDH
jgi:signal transduction histidine kinase